MGVNDKRRFPVFADFIRKTWPEARTVADVAGGRGKLSYYLREHGFDPSIIDRRDAHLPGWMRKTLRKQSVERGRLVEIPRIVGNVQDVDLRPFDVVVALHPDAATEHTVRAALELDKDFAVVPCCVFPMDGIRRSQEDWRGYLASLSADMQTATLPIGGDNLVLYRRA